MAAVLVGSAGVGAARGWAFYERSLAEEAALREAAANLAQRVGVVQGRYERQRERRRLAEAAAEGTREAYLALLMAVGGAPCPEAP